MTALNLIMLLACSSTVVTEDPLAVLTISPSHGAVGVPLDTEVRAVFSQALTEDSLAIDDLDLLDSAGNELTVARFYDADSQSISLVPADDLAPGSSYQLVLGAGLEASGGGTLGVRVTAHFTTAGVAEEQPVDTGDTGGDTGNDTGDTAGDTGDSAP